MSRLPLSDLFDLLSKQDQLVFVSIFGKIIEGSGSNYKTFQFHSDDALVEDVCFFIKNESDWFFRLK